MSQRSNLYWSGETCSGRIYSEQSNIIQRYGYGMTNSLGKEVNRKHESHYEHEDIKQDWHRMDYSGKKEDGECGVTSRFRYSIIEHPKAQIRDTTRNLVHCLIIHKDQGALRTTCGQRSPESVCTALE